MKEYMLVSVIKECEKREKIIIVGAGIAGEELYQLLKRHHCFVSEFWDNNDNKTGNTIDNVPIKKPYKLQDSECLYIIAARVSEYKVELFEQLLGLGINAVNIIVYNDLASQNI